MRRTALALALLTAAAPAHAADPDPFFGPDKALHFTASAAIAAGGYTLGAALFEPRAHALALGAGLSAAAGLAKEGADLAGLGDPSWKDLAWDGIGLVTGLAVAFGVDLLVRGVSARHPPFERGRAEIAF